MLVADDFRSIAESLKRIQQEETKSKGEAEKARSNNTYTSALPVTDGHHVANDFPHINRRLRELQTARDTAIKNSAVKMDGPSAPVEPFFSKSGYRPAFPI